MFEIQKSMCNITKVKEQICTMCTSQSGLCTNNVSICQTPRCKLISSSWEFLFKLWNGMAFGKRSGLAYVSVESCKDPHAV
jgi:hypothetical protein